MDHLNHPSWSLWEQRRRWFEEIEADTRGNGNYLVSEQACALIAEVECVFCAGAWVAVILLATSVIDAQLRETEAVNVKVNTKRLFDELCADKDLDWLRLRRNALVHVDPENPALTVDNQWSARDRLEEDARKAVRLMFETFYLSPST